MTTRDWIEIAFTLIGAANVYVLLLVRYEVSKLKNELSDRFVNKEEFDRFTDTLFSFMGAKPLSHGRRVGK
jgi:hypothetical protein